jgi:hypothetical protein
MTGLEPTCQEALACDLTNGCFDGSHPTTTCLYDCSHHSAKTIAATQGGPLACAYCQCQTPCAWLPMGGSPVPSCP